MAVASRRDKYTKKGEMEDLELLSERLTQDIRKHIRNMGSFPVLSEPWMAMADTLGRLAHITEMEKALPKTSSSATLWECEEVALRYIIEDGKLNLCLRNLIAYKQFQQSTSSEARSVEAHEKMDQFEKGMGVMLQNAWKHVEAAQTTEMSTLFPYIAQVLQYILDPSRDGYMEQLSKLGDLELRQDSIVFSYLRDVMSHIEQLGEDRIMPLILERNIPSLAAKVLQRYHTLYSSETLCHGAEALAAIASTEHFMTYQDRYIRSDDDTMALISLERDIIEGLVDGDMDLRRTLRPLRDLTSSLRRRLMSK